MKKIIICLTVLMLLCGCSSGENKNDDINNEVQDDINENQLDDKNDNEQVNNQMITLQMPKDTADFGIFYDEYIVELLNEMENDSRVLAYNKLGIVGLHPVDYKAVESEKKDDQIPVGTEEINEMKMLYNNSANMIELNNGDIEVIQGRFYNQQEVENGDKVILVMSDFATQNNLEIGDKIKFSYLNDYSYLTDYIDEKDLFIEYEIIGIFEGNVLPVSNGYNSDVYEDNLLLAPSTSILNYNDMYQNALLDQDNDAKNTDEGFFADEIESYNTRIPTILLKDASEIEGFVADYQEKLKDYYTIQLID